MKRFVLLVVCALVAGCAASQFIVYNCATSPRDCGTAVTVATQNKVLAFAPSPCGGPGSNKPYLVSGWVREKDISRAVVVCKPDCTDCRIVVRKH